MRGSEELLFGVRPPGAALACLPATQLRIKLVSRANRLRPGRPPEGGPKRCQATPGAALACLPATQLRIKLVRARIDYALEDRPKVGQSAARPAHSKLVALPNDAETG